MTGELASRYRQFRPRVVTRSEVEIHPDVLFVLGLADAPAAKGT